MTAKALRILLVEDNVCDARLLREMFGKETSDSFELTHLLRLREAEIHLQKGEVDIAPLDMGLPDGHPFRLPTAGWRQFKENRACRCAAF